jgi:hypothetical protein
MAVLPMRVLSAVQVAWDGGVTQVRAGSLVSIDPGNAALVAAYGGLSNLQDMTGAPGDGSTLDNGVTN